MNLITEEYRQLNRQLHADREDYGTTAPRYAQQVADVASAIAARSILDYGCGKGLLRQGLSHLMVAEYDPAIEGKETAPYPADLVACIDVLEHIEPDCLDDVLDDLLRMTISATFVTIATTPAKKVLADGRNAHLIIEHPRWWLQKIFERWDLNMYQITPGGFMALLTPMQRAQTNGAQTNETASKTTPTST